jgi:8-oxo-dGTP diphosphatase
MSASSSGNDSGGAGQYTYRYPRPSVTVDTLIFTADPDDEAEAERAEAIRLLLIKRKHPPFQGMYALPGGFVDPDEDLEVAATRELEEETGLTNVSLAQVGAFGKPGRDPRGHTITVAYTAFCLLGRAAREAAVRAGDDAAEAAWFPVSRLPPLAFDHEEVVRAAWGRLELGGGGSAPTSFKERGSGKVLLLVPVGGEGHGNIGEIYLTTKLGFSA